VTADPISSPDDIEAARLLREMAASPRQAIIWPLHHGHWSGNTLDAFQRGCAALKAEGSWAEAVVLLWLERNPGDVVASVLQTRQWPREGARVMLDAAGALDPEPADA
jgi:hypothetical protein